MKISSILLIVLFSFASLIGLGQNDQNSDSRVFNEKAMYVNGNLQKFLSTHVSYPKDAVNNNVEGDVVISFIVNQAGKTEGLTLVSSSDLSLSTNSMVAFNSIGKEWVPAKVNQLPVSKKYLLIFRYNLNPMPESNECTEKVKAELENKKYDKALKICNKAIEADQYNFQMIRMRSSVKELAGDPEGAKKDQLDADQLEDKLMAVVIVKPNEQRPANTGGMNNIQSGKRRR
jgi:hypothetical protein